MFFRSPMAPFHSTPKNVIAEVQEIRVFPWNLIKCEVERGAENALQRNEPEAAD